jgi:phosphate starvation-inducible PhoH-like protein
LSKKRQTRRQLAENNISPATEKKSGNFKIEFLNAEQKTAWKTFEDNDIIFCLGAAGCGKTFLSTAYACQAILTKSKKKITLTRPIVESQESMGYLPGSMEEKLNPYLMPMYDSLDDLVGKAGPQRDIINHSIEISPIAFQRGRAETLDSPVLTPNGFVPMGQIQIGDKVVGSNGKSINVTGVFPQGKKKIYKVSFTDKTFVKCSGDHLWSTMTLSEKRHNKGFSVKTTEEILKSVKNKYKQKNHKVPILSGPVEFKEKEVLVDPYLLGVLLGDGSIRDSMVRISTSDEEILTECMKRIPANMSMKYCGKYDYRIVGDGKKQKLCALLEEYNLLNTKSNNKFVPEDYKINSVENRLEILRGLMDTDGSIFLEKRSNRVRMQYYTVSWQLAQDVMFLVRSLGGTAYYRKREFDESDSHDYKGHSIRHVHASYVVDVKIGMNPFKLSRKSKKYENGIHPVFAKLISDVEYIGEDECQCISVDSKDHLYVTNGFNITHNTHKDAICLFDEAQNATYMGLKLFLTRIGNNAKLIINGDPAQSDLRGPVALVDIVKRLEGIPGIAVIRFSDKAIVRHPLIEKMLQKL